MRERDGARQWCRAIRVDGAKRLRRSRWERGTCERVARGGVRPLAGAGGYIHEDRDSIPRDRAKGCSRSGAQAYKGGVGATRDARPGSSRECGGCGQRTGRIERAGPPPGGPVRSIRKNNVLPGSGPTDLHYGKNGYVLSGVERTGPPGGGPARVARRERAGGGGSAVRTERRGQDRRKPAIRGP